MGSSSVTITRVVQLRVIFIIRGSAASTVKIAGRDVLATWKVLISLGVAPILYGPMLCLQSQLP